MNKKTILIFASFLTIFYTNIYAKDIYTYTKANATPVKILLNTQKITFSSNQMTVFMQDGTRIYQDFSTFNYFSFYKKAISTSIFSNKKTTDNIYFDGTSIHIQSDQKIHAVIIYSALGIKVAQFFPSSKYICYSLSALPKGLYLVRVFTEKNVMTEKVFKNN